jgi:hypothetical protein
MPEIRPLKYLPKYFSINHLTIFRPLVTTIPPKKILQHKPYVLSGKTITGFQTLKRYELYACQRHKQVYSSGYVNPVTPVNLVNGPYAFAQLNGLFRSDKKKTGALGDFTRRAGKAG